MGNDKVNVHRTAFRQHERSNGAQIRVQEIEHLPQPSWIERILPAPQELLVNGRHVTGFVIPHWAAGVLLAAILGSVGFMYSQLSNQRDMLIRLDTQLQERDKHELEYREEFKTKTNVQALQIENMSSELRAIRAVLTPLQVKSIQREPKTDN